MPLDQSNRLALRQPNHPPSRHFSFFRAERAADLIAACRLRYQVYCIERRLLDKGAYPQRIERDDFDPHSLHFLARHTSGLHAGTARLVLNSPLGFPLARHCELAPDYAFLKDRGAPALSGYAEISRLAVSRNFRHRNTDTFYGGPPRHFVSESEAVSRNTPEIVSGLYRLLYQDSKRNGVSHWVVAMERGLHVILKRLGFVFTPIGPEIDYFGPVRPYVASIDVLEGRLYRAAPAAYRYMASGLERTLLPAYFRDQEDSRRANLDTTDDPPGRQATPVPG